MAAQAPAGPGKTRDKAKYTLISGMKLLSVPQASQVENPGTRPQAYTPPWQGPRGTDAIHACMVMVGGDICLYFSRSLKARGALQCEHRQCQLGCMHSVCVYIYIYRERAECQ